MIDGFQPSFDRSFKNSIIFRRAAYPNSSKKIIDLQQKRLRAMFVLAEYHIQPSQIDSCASTEMCYHFICHLSQSRFSCRVDFSAF